MADCVSETISTLKFADRAKQIMADMQERESESPNSPWGAVIDVAMNQFGDEFYSRGDELLAEEDL